MREILFRGKRIANGEWVEGYYCPCSFGRFPCRPAIIIKEDMDNGRWHPEEIIPETVGQYTGLTDKNGNKIFEGDIIDTPDRLVKVVWLTGNSQFDLDFIRYANDVTITNFKGIHMSDLKEYEIIGSIHDNPELLKGESNE